MHQANGSKPRRVTVLLEQDKATELVSWWTPYLYPVRGLNICVFVYVFIFSSVKQGCHMMWHHLLVHWSVRILCQGWLAWSVMPSLPCRHPKTPHLCKLFMFCVPFVNLIWYFYVNMTWQFYLSTCVLLFWFGSIWLELGRVCLWATLLLEAYDKPPLQMGAQPGLLLWFGLMNSVWTLMLCGCLLIKYISSCGVEWVWWFAGGLHDTLKGWMFLLCFRIVLVMFLSGHWFSYWEPVVGGFRWWFGS